MIEQVADPKDVVRTLVAFANDYSNLGGGYIVCGAKEAVDEFGFPQVIKKGLESALFKEIEGRVMSSCISDVDPHIVPNVDEVTLPESGLRILIFVMPATRRVHSFRETAQQGPVCFIRVGRETKIAKNGLFRQLLVRKGEVPPWDRRTNPAASVDDIDLLRLREFLVMARLWDGRRSAEEYLAPDFQIHAMVPPLTEKEPLTGVLKPRNFALLLFGREPTRYIPGAYSILSVYPGVDRSDRQAERHEFFGPVLEQATRLKDRLGVEAVTIFDKEDIQPNLFKFPKLALEEALVNTVVHRDYEMDQPSRITIFADRVEFLSPGPLPSAVNKDEFVGGRSPPHWRNQTLAFFLMRAQFAQAEGQGIPTIYKSMRDEGCPPPRFELNSASVTCVLHAHPRSSLRPSRRP